MDKILKEIAEKHNLEMEKEISKLKENRQDVINKLFEEETIEALINMNTNNRNLIDLRSKLLYAKVHGTKMVAEELRNKLNDKIMNLVMNSKFDELKAIAKDIKIINDILINANKNEDKEVKVNTEVEVDTVKIDVVEENKKKIEKVTESEKINELENHKEYVNIGSYEEASRVTGINIPTLSNNGRAVYCTENNLIVIGQYMKQSNSVTILKNSLIPRKNIVNSKDERVKEIFQWLREEEMVEVSGDYFKVTKEIYTKDIEDITNFMIGKEVNYKLVWKNENDRKIINIK